MSYFFTFISVHASLLKGMALGFLLFPIVASMYLFIGVVFASTDSYSDH